MFEDLRAAFRQAVENFNRELHRDRVPETFDEILKGMKRELVDARAHLSDLEDQVERTTARARHEAEQVEVCRRREQMARSIEDSETADIAAEYLERHRQRHGVLERKLTTLREELELQRREVEEMTDRLRQATTERESLTAASGRVGARNSIAEADELFAELDRMTERIASEDARAEAAPELSDLDTGAGNASDLHVDLDSGPPEPPDVDAALAELKRRMGKD